MGAPLRAVNLSPAGLAWGLPAAAFALPLLAALGWALAEAFDAEAWMRLFADAAWWPALRLGLWVGSAATLASLSLSLWLVTRLHGTSTWRRVEPALAGLLAVPHAAFAVGLALLLMPSGLIARLLAPLAGWEAPPDVATVQDPAGLALILGLVLKELPFLLWNIAAQLRPAAQAATLRQQLQTAQTLGYPTRSAWWRVLWPQLLPRLALPVLAVWAYGSTVIDMALVLGPARPPTLAVLAWQWLRDADPAMHRQGAAAALLLTIVTAAGAGGAALLARALAAGWRVRCTRGDRPAAPDRAAPARTFAAGAGIVYTIVLVLLAFVSFAGVWTFPSLAPQRWSADAWATVAAAGSTLAVTAGLGAVSSLTGLVLALAWMESTPPAWDARAAPLVFAPMLVPGLLLASGLYRLALQLDLDGSLAGLWLAHSLYTAPYVLVALAPAWRGFDGRYRQVAAALGCGRARALWRVQGPMLRAPIASALAVGFAVSVGQYLSTQFVGAGRHATVTTEALTLAAGGQRPLLAAFALLQALLPALAFAAAWWIGRRQARRLGTEA